ncbi:MAG: ABC transporter ATP-binding protein [Candidatus Woesearchaeota archaeon]
MEYSVKAYFKDMWAFLKGRRIPFVWFTFLRFLSGAMEFIEPFLFGLIITYFSEYTGGSLQIFYLIVLGLVVSFTTRITLRFYSKFKLQEIGAWLKKDIRMFALQNLLQLNLEWHQEENTGEKIEKINEGAERIVRTFGEFSNAWLSIITTITTGVFLLFVIHPILGAYTTLMIVVFGITYSFTHKKLPEYKKKERIAAEKVSGKIYESTSNITSIKTLGLHSTILKASNALEEDHTNKFIEFKRFSTKRSALIIIELSLMWGIYVLLIGNLFLQEKIALGMILTLSLYFNSVRRNLNISIWEINNFISSKVSFGRLMNIINAQKYSKTGTHTIPKKWENIILENVSFSYKDKKVLNNVSITIPKGKKIAIIGESGSGKSTITKLLMNLYNTKGMSIDSIPLEEIKSNDLFSFFSIALQDTEVFNDTILYNITLGLEDETKPSKKVQKILDICQLNSFIEKLPEGLKTNIGEKGLKLSGGQRQRINLARCLYSKNEVLIFDEATSNLDTKTEAKIVDALIQAYPQKTQIIITHRMQTIKHVDYVYVLDKGTIIAEGTYKKVVENTKIKNKRNTKKVIKKKSKQKSKNQ